MVLFFDSDKYKELFCIQSFLCDQLPHFGYLLFKILCLCCERCGCVCVHVCVCVCMNIFMHTYSKLSFVSNIHLLYINIFTFKYRPNHLLVFRSIIRTVSLLIKALTNKQVAYRVISTYCQIKQRSSHFHSLHNLRIQAKFWR